MQEEPILEAENNSKRLKLDKEEETNVNSNGVQADVGEVPPKAEPEQKEKAVEVSKDQKLSAETEEEAKMLKVSLEQTVDANVQFEKVKQHQTGIEI